MNGLSIRLLGSPHVELDGKPAALEARTATALLADLAVRRATRSQSLRRRSRSNPAASLPCVCRARCIASCPRRPVERASASTSSSPWPWPRPLASDRPKPVRRREAAGCLHGKRGGHPRIRPRIHELRTPLRVFVAILVDISRSYLPTRLPH